MAKPWEPRHVVGNALAAVSACARLLMRPLTPGATRGKRQTLAVVQDDLLHARRSLRSSPATVPADPRDLQSLLALAISQMPAERAADLRVRSAEPLVSRGQPDRIVQVLAHLLDNAARHSLPGTLIEVETSRISDEAGDWALVVVRDHGIGMARDALEPVLAGDPTDAAGRLAPGASMRLQLSRRPNESDDGQFWVTGMPGCGSSAYAQLPLARQVAAEPTRADLLGRSAQSTEDAATVMSATR